MAIFWNRSQWVPLCVEHHNRDAQQVETRGYADRIGIDGYPVDPNHPFNRTSPDTPGEAESPTVKDKEPVRELSSELVPSETIERLD